MKTRSRIRGALAAVLVVAAGACGTDAPDAPGAAGAVGSGASASAAQTASPAALSAGDSIEFVATEFSFTPSQLQAEPGSYSATFVNNGTIEHDIKFDNGDAIVAGAGETVEFEFEVPEEGVRYWCSIPGHEDAGMSGMITTAASAADGDRCARRRSRHNRHRDGGRSRSRRTSLRVLATRGRLLAARARASR